MSPTLGTRFGQLASFLKALFHIAFGLAFLLAPATFLNDLGLARHGTLTEWLLWPALLGLTVFYALLLIEQLPRRRAYVVAVLESSSTALIVALYAITHEPLNPWIVGFTVFFALIAALFWYALIDS